MGNEALVMGYETALDFWRASRIASEGQHVLEDAGRVFGPRALELHERAALAALTSRAELVGYAKSARAVGVRGAGKAVRALDLATGGSASPRETDLAVFFLLSRRLGGADLGGFAVNASLEVSQRHRETLEGQSEVKPDFLWTDAKLVVEYDSNAHHLTPKKNGTKLDAFVDDLTCRLGLRRRSLTKWQQDSRDKLRERLFGVQN